MGCWESNLDQQRARQTHFLLCYCSSLPPPPLFYSKSIQGLSSASRRAQLVHYFVQRMKQTPPLWVSALQLVLW